MRLAGRPGSFGGDPTAGARAWPGSRPANVLAGGDSRAVNRRADQLPVPPSVTDGRLGGQRRRCAAGRGAQERGQQRGDPAGMAARTTSEKASKRMEWRRPWIGAAVALVLLAVACASAGGGAPTGGTSTGGGAAAVSTSPAGPSAAA